MKKRRVVVFLAVQVALILILAEAALRVVGPKSETLRRLLTQPASVERLEGCATLEELLETSIVGFRPCTPAYGFMLNSRSLRTREYDRTKNPGEYRILAMGDSFTWASGGLPHRHHWPTILEGELNRRGDRVEVLRLGVPATGPPFQRRLWQLEGAHLDADLVVVAFFVGNDFTEHHSELLEGDLRSSDWRGRMLEGSAIVRVVVNLFKARGAVEDRGETGNDTAADIACGEVIPGSKWTRGVSRPKLDSEAFLAIEQQRMALCHVSKERIFDELAIGALDTLLRFRNEVETAGARFVVMLIPDEYQVSPDVARAVVERSGRSLAEYDLDKPQGVLSRGLALAGVDVLDLLPAFREGAATAPLYGVRDTHWNAEGNRLAAKILAEHLHAMSPPLSSHP